MDFIPVGTYTLLLFYRPMRYHLRIIITMHYNSHILKRCVFLIMQLLQTHVKQVNLNLTVMASYQERLSRLVTQLQPEQLNELLWRDDGDLAFLIYIFIRRVSVGVYPMFQGVLTCYQK